MSWRLPRFFAYMLMACALAAAVTGLWHLGELARNGAFGKQAISPGPVDVGFAQAMATHHDQAVLMSQILLSGEPGRLGPIAMAIQTAQLLEIGQMQGWLMLWDRSPLPTTRSMDWMLKGKSAPDASLLGYLAECRSSPGGMPGLASTDELNRLRAENGLARERLFLQLMIRHHLYALPMARFAAANAETPAVRTLAAKIVFDQSRETEQLTRLLRARETEPVRDEAGKPG